MPKILGTKFDPVSFDQALEQILQWSKGQKKRHIVTPNPEIVLEARENKKFRNILNNSDLSIADGIGILWASTYLNGAKTFFRWMETLFIIPIKPEKIKKILPERVTGTDLLQEICKQSDEKIFLLGAAPGIAEKAAEKLGNNIVGTYSGSPKPKYENEICEKINKSQAKILFVAYGAPKQELWISHNLKKLKTVKVAIGVGGAFDFVAGKRQRAPKWMQSLGLEWLYRIIQEPSRIKRIYNATIKFPIAVFREN